MSTGLGSTIRLFLIALGLLLSGSVHAQEWWQVYPNDNEDYLRKLANEGDAGAQFQFATKLLDGRRSNKYPTAGLNWLRESAQQGFTKAELRLGQYYLDQHDVPMARDWLLRAAAKAADPAGVIATRTLGYTFEEPDTQSDPKEAASWYRLAAERGDAHAQLALGQMYLDGRGVQKDPAEGLRWMKRSAASKLKIATYVLAIIYAQGIETDPDAREAASQLFGPRANRTEPEAYYSMGTFYSRGFDFEKDQKRLMSWVFVRNGASTDAIAKYFAAQDQYLPNGYQWADPERAFQMYQKGAEGGHVGAQVNLGLMYYDNRSRHWDCGKTMKWLRAAADQGDPIAQLNLGSLYKAGFDRTIVMIGVQIERVKDGLLVRDVTKGSPAQRGGLRVADVILSSDGIPLADQGVSFQERISGREGRSVALVVQRGGNRESMTVVPEKTVQKCPGAEEAGLKQDFQEAARWFRRSADGGHLSGLFFLAAAYRAGEGVAKDAAKAVDLYKRGAARGDWQAALALHEMYAKGDGVDQDKPLSDEWYRKALKLRHDSLGKGTEYYFQK